MRRAEAVIFALGALGETGKAAALPQGADAVAPAGEDLVRIGLMPDVPDQPVRRGVEHGMQRHRQFDDAEAGTEMTAGHRDRTDGLGAQFVRHLAELMVLQLSEVGRGRKGIEKRGSRSHYWNTFARLHGDLQRNSGPLGCKSKNHTQRKTYP